MEYFSQIKPKNLEIEWDPEFISDLHKIAKSQKLESDTGKLSRKSASEIVKMAVAKMANEVISSEIDAIAKIQKAIIIL